MRSQKPPLKEIHGNKETDVYFENQTQPVRVERMKRTEKNVVVVQLLEGIYIAAAPFLDQDFDMQDRVVGLLFAREERTYGSTFGCLLARQKDGDIYERVGAIPHLMAFPRNPNAFSIHRLEVTFLDESGGILDKVRIPVGQQELLFDNVGERETIFLV